MRHRVTGRKLNRTKAHRQALMRNLSAALIENEKITTTLPKAKELRRFAEKLVTLSKKESLHARRIALQRVPNPRAIAKLFDTLSARFSQRPGGYTRIIKLGPRRGDNAEMAVIEFVGSEVKVKSEDDESADETTETKGKATKKKAAAKKTAKKKTTKKKTAAKKPAAKKKTKKKPAAKKTTKSKS